MKPEREIPLYLRCINSGAVFDTLPAVASSRAAVRKYRTTGSAAPGAGSHAPAAVVAGAARRYPFAR